MTTESARAEVERILAQWTEEVRADPRLRDVRVGRRKLWTVHCASCATDLAVGENLVKTRALARRNATARPCCDLWRAP